MSSCAKSSTAAFRSNYFYSRNGYGKICLDEGSLEAFLTSESSSCAWESLRKEYFFLLLGLNSHLSL